MGNAKSSEKKHGQRLAIEFVMAIMNTPNTREEKGDRIRRVASATGRTRLHTHLG
jgi:hypothetical protein